MKILRLLTATAIALISGLATHAQVEPEEPLALFENNGELGCEFNDLFFPQINALTVLNDGQMCIFGVTAFPYEFSNTRSFVNSGVITGAPGYWFNTFTENGRGAAESFINTGDISAASSGGSGFFPGTTGGFLTFGANSYAMIWADDIRHKGSVTADGGGLIQLLGRTVTITNSALVINPVGGSGDGSAPFSFFGFNMTSSNFFPEVGLNDIAWSVESPTNANASIYIGPAVVTPAFNLTNSFGVQRTSLALLDPLAFVLTNDVVNGTNFVTQAVFVEKPDDVEVQVGWIDEIFEPGATPTDGFLTAVVRLFQTSIDLVTGEQITNQVVIVDALAKSTNYNLLTNVFMGTLRPAPILVTRTAPTDFNGPPFVTANVPNDEIANDPALLDPLFNVTNALQTTTNQQVAYSVEIENSALLPLGSSAAVSTNRTGRVEIFSESLNMARARIRGEGLIHIETDNLISSHRAVVDSVHLNLKLGATGPLIVTNMAKPFVDRFVTQFPIDIWSGVWTNGIDSEMVVTNDDPAQAPTTNIITTNYLYHALVVDANGLLSRIPVQVHQFSGRSSLNGPSVVVLEDLLRVQESFELDARNIIINNVITLAEDIHWTSDNIRNVETLTIGPAGGISIFDTANFGGRLRYRAVTNQGAIQAYSVRINANYFENTGDILAAGVIGVSAADAKIDGGVFETAGDVVFTGTSVKFANTTIDTDGAIRFNVSDLYDSGPQAGNVWTTRKGIMMDRRPNTGDLLGTRIVIDLPQFGLSENVWASPRNDGAQGSGFNQNVAIGNLVLNGRLNSLFVFNAPDTAPAAIYVDLLELSPEVLTDLESIVIAQNVEIIFADVRSTDGGDVDVTALTSRVFPGGGRMRWASDFAGPNSSVDVLLESGETTRVNRLLSVSPFHDSDGDGIPNSEEQFPFPAPQISGLSFNRAGGAISFKWQAPAKSSMYLESSSNPKAQGWEIVRRFTNDSTQETEITSGAISTESQQRFYRIRVVK